MYSMNEERQESSTEVTHTLRRSLAISLNSANGSCAQILQSKESTAEKKRALGTPSGGLELSWLAG